MGEANKAASRAFQVCSRVSLNDRAPIDLTPDHKTLFVGIQHPGETGTLDAFQSNWPAASGADASLPGAVGNRPRTSMIAISRIDGGDTAV